jgi:hypothetical protein
MMGMIEVQTKPIRTKRRQPAIRQPGMTVSRITGTDIWIDSIGRYWHSTETEALEGPWDTQAQAERALSYWIETWIGP